MKNNYFDKNRTIGRFRCITIHDPIGNTWDDCLAGELGEIWWADEARGILKAFKVINRKHEKIFTFDIKDLEKWILRLRVPPKPIDQIMWVINPNQRLD